MRMYRTARYSPAGIECDVSEPDNAVRFLEEAHRGLGHVDVVVNAAGGSFQRLFQPVTQATGQQISQMSGSSSGGGSGSSSRHVSDAQRASLHIANVIKSV